MDICVIIPARNEQMVLAHSIQSALRAGINPEDIYVIDDGSSDGTSDIARSLNVQVLRNPVNIGKAKSLRKVIDCFHLDQRYNYIALLDADSRISKDYFKEIESAFQRDDKVVMVSGAVESIPHNWLTAHRALECLWGQSAYKKGQEKMGVILVTPGCATAIKSLIVSRLDFNNDTLTEDMDTTIQIHRKKLGKIAFADKAVSYTQDPAGIREYFKQTHRWYSGTWQVIRKHGIPFGHQKIDLEVALLMSEGLFVPFAFLFFLFWFPPAIGWAMLTDIFMTISIATYFSWKTKRTDILRYSFLFPLIKICNSFLLLVTFFQIVIRRKEMTNWFTPKRYVTLSALVLLGLGVLTHDALAAPLALPGNTWLSGGNLSPAEENNVIAHAHAEQGVTVWEHKRRYLIPYIAIDAVTDTKGHSWNNRLILRAGPKLTRIYRKGVTQLHLQLGREQRYNSGESRTELMVYGDYWFGWEQLSEKPKGRSELFPGSTWGALGILSPFEPDNLMGVVDIQQGAQIAKVGNLHLIPFLKFQAGADKKEYDWNNKVIGGIGIKLLLTPTPSDAMETGLQFLQENRWKTGRNATMLSWFYSHWFGWSAKTGGKK